MVDGDQGPRLLPGVGGQGAYQPRRRQRSCEKLHQLKGFLLASASVGLLARYDELLLLTGRPVVRLNRAVAIGQADGPLAGLAALLRSTPTCLVTPR